MKSARRSNNLSSSCSSNSMRRIGFFLLLTLLLNTEALSSAASVEQQQQEQQQQHKYALKNIRARRTDQKDEPDSNLNSNSNLNTHTSTLHLSSLSQPTSSEEESSRSSASSEVEEDERRLIIGGSIAKAKKYLWFASVDLDTDAHCGASLVAPDLLLTSASCEFAFPTGAMVGAYFYRNLEKSPDGQVVKITEKLIHPRYNASNVAEGGTLDDLMLMKISPPVSSMEPIAINFDPSFPPEAPKTTGVITNDNATKQSLTILGFGMTTETDIKSTTVLLLEATVFAYNTEECNWFYYDSENQLTNKTHLCVEARSPDRMACGGDSGGPVFTSIRRPTPAISTTLKDLEAQSDYVKTTPFAEEVEAIEQEEDADSSSSVYVGANIRLPNNNRRRISRKGLSKRAIKKRHEEQFMPILLGVHSGTIAPKCTQGPSVYVRLSGYEDFLKQSMCLLSNFSNMILWNCAQVEAKQEFTDCLGVMRKMNRVECLNCFQNFLPIQQRSTMDDMAPVTAHCADLQSSFWLAPHRCAAECSGKPKKRFANSENSDVTCAAQAIVSYWKHATGCIKLCAVQGEVCTSSKDCCDDMMCGQTGSCIPLQKWSAKCRKTNKTCNKNSDCCSQSCKSGTCT